MAERPTLILDVMGADLGSEEMVRGAAQACTAAGGPFDLILVSAEPELTRRQAQARLAGPAAQAGCGFEVLAATDHLPEHIDSPVDAFRDYPQCSIRMAMDKAKEIPHSAVISPGTTGVVMTAALFTLGRVRGIERPPIGTPMPTKGKELFFVDGGSNVDCRPAQLYQFAVLAHLYLKNIRGVARPSIALLSNGSEAYKGNQVVREAYALIKADGDLNFVGFTEGHTMWQGDLDIMVCDGFLGNILLKLAEGVAEAFSSMLKQEMRRDLLAALAAKLLQRRVYRRMADRIDYAAFGGAPLLGLNGNVVICHGRSTARAIMNALLVGHQLARTNISQQVAQYVEAHAQLFLPRDGGRRTNGQ
jgi:glycerol-3-phosphate acyltransferase PlsX